MDNETNTDIFGLKFVLNLRQNFSHFIKMTAHFLVYFKCLVF